MGEPKYRAFISYSHRDTGWATWLHRSLEGYRPPKDLVGTVTRRGPIPKRLHPVFRDREELASATDLGTLINAALEESACQIVICSPPAAKSKWVNEEILAFKRLGREDRIFCLIVDGEPNASDMPGREDEECFPPALRFRLGADGRLGEKRTEPIAADARPGKDGRNNAKLKLIAGLLGVGFDALRRRDQARRNRRLVIFSFAALTGMIFASGLAAYALFQRGVARKQTKRAEAEAAAATATTKFLVDLFRISDPSEARGNSVTAREMLDRGAARIDTELAKQPAVQARLMDTLGTVYMGLGLYQQAMPLLEHAIERRRHLAGIDPLELSDSLSHEGQLLYLKADYAAGEKAYRDAIALEMAHPGERRYQVALASSTFGLGVLLAEQGRNAEAEQRLGDALALQKTLFGDDSADVARTLKALSWCMADSGRLAGAIPLMQQAVSIQRQLRGAEPHPDLAEAISDLGSLLERSGDMNNAEKNLREALAMKRRLLGEKHPEIALGLENLAEVLADKGDFDEAERLYRQSIDMYTGLAGPDHPDIANIEWNLAALQYDRGETAAALANALDVLAKWRRAYPPDHPRTALALNVIGYWLALDGRHAEAEHYLQDGLAMRHRLFTADQPEIASSLVNLSILRSAQRRYDEALQLAQQARDIFTHALSADDWRTAVAEGALGAALKGLGRYPDAEAALDHSYSILKQDSAAPLSYRQLTRRYLDELHQHGQRHAAAASQASAGR